MAAWRAFEPTNAAVSRQYVAACWQNSAPLPPDDVPSLPPPIPSNCTARDHAGDQQLVGGTGRGGEDESWVCRVWWGQGETGHSVGMY